MHHLWLSFAPAVVRVCLRAAVWIVHAKVGRWSVLWKAEPNNGKNAGYIQTTALYEQIICTDPQHPGRVMKMVCMFRQHTTWMTATRICSRAEVLCYLFKLCVLWIYLCVLIYWLILCGNDNFYAVPFDGHRIIFLWMITFKRLFINSLKWLWNGCWNTQFNYVKQLSCDIIGFIIIHHQLSSVIVSIIVSVIIGGDDCFHYWWLMRWLNIVDDESLMINDDTRNVNRLVFRVGFDFARKSVIGPGLKVKGSAKGSGSLTQKKDLGIWFGFRKIHMWVQGFWFWVRMILDTHIFRKPKPKTRTHKSRIRILKQKSPKPGPLNPHVDFSVSGSSFGFGPEKSWTGSIPGSELQLPVRYLWTQNPNPGKGAVFFTFEHPWIIPMIYKSWN